MAVKRMPPDDAMPVEGIPGVSVRFRELDGRNVICGLYFESDRVKSDDLRLFPLARIEASLNSTEQLSVDLPPLSREGLTPEEFSRLVAEWYMAYRRVTPNAARAMATHFAVKAPTMAGWIREARLRGFLPRGWKR